MGAGRDVRDPDSRFKLQVRMAAVNGRRMAVLEFLLTFACIAQRLRTGDRRRICRRQVARTPPPGSAPFRAGLIITRGHRSARCDAGGNSYSSRSGSSSLGAVPEASCRPHLAPLLSRTRQAADRSAQGSGDRKRGLELPGPGLINPHPSSGRR